MAKSYCLTVEVKSEAIENGLGYMIAFSLPDDRLQPDQVPDFTAWSDQVKTAVLRAGDQVYDPDPYTKKLAIAELMNELAQLNERYDIRIGGQAGIPAVQIQSTNPFDNQIDIEFSGKDGEFHVSEHGLHDLQRSKVDENGKTGFVEGTPHHFPFTKTLPAVTKKPPQPRPPGL
ncbi:MAG: hypothetical protein EPN97_08260 [Alphaproteobacteria bacterium]|nr:MAG: hypothetical protein EPN97_08260 [Alphaproteobacteria bacterium]